MGTRKLCRGHEILCRGHEILCRGNEILSRGNEIIMSWERDKYFFFHMSCPLSAAVRLRIKIHHLFTQHQGLAFI